MRKGQLVEYDTLNRALRDVQNELYELGIYDRLDQVDVYWCRFSQLAVPTALGFFVHERTPIVDRLLDYREGHIYIPRWVPFQFWNQNRGSLRSVIRHEFAHALWYYHPSAVNTRTFRTIFGGPHGWQGRDVDQPDDAFVSDYAATCPAEDFAETFGYWVTNRKRVSARCYHPVLKRKLEFIGNMLKRLKG